MNNPIHNAPISQEGNKCAPTAGETAEGITTPTQNAEAWDLCDAIACDLARYDMSAEDIHAMYSLLG